LITGYPQIPLSQKFHGEMDAPQLASGNGQQVPGDGGAAADYDRVESAQILRADKAVQQIWLVMVSSAIAMDKTTNL
jgi:hypothetical protein